jgi:hypothetical protein
MCIRIVAKRSRPGGTPIQRFAISTPLFSAVSLLVALAFNAPRLHAQTGAGDRDIALAKVVESRR